MTAHVGYPTLRLIRHKAGPFELGGLLPGQYRRVRVPAPLMRLAESKPRLPPNQRKPVKPTRGA
jgi:23S rRNA pseudouridine2457 synthase